MAGQEYQNWDKITRQIVRSWHYVQQLRRTDTVTPNSDNPDVTVPL